MLEQIDKQWGKRATCHGVNQTLVSVAQIGRQPARGLGDSL